MFKLEQKIGTESPCVGSILLRFGAIRCNMLASFKILGPSFGISADERRDPPHNILLSYIFEVAFIWEAG